MTKTTHETTLKPRMKPRFKLLILKGNHANHAWNPRTYMREKVCRGGMRRVCVSRAYTWGSVVSVVSVVSMTYERFMRGFMRGFSFSCVVFSECEGNWA